MVDTPGMTGSRYDTSHPIRPPVHGHAAVTSSQPLATAAGVEILLAGGNSADAAIAVGAALAVTEPCANGLGGDVIALAYTAETHDVVAILGNGRTPADLDVSHFPLQSATHGSAVTVPGAVRAWADISARFGSIPLAAALNPAIRLARDGFPVGPRVAAAWASAASVLSPHCSLHTAEGRAPGVGELFRNHELADVLQAIARDGADAFYTGDVATRICNAVRDSGGAMAPSDLAAHTTRFERPVATTYRGMRILECGAPTHGLAALLSLNIAERFDIGSMQRASADALHVLIESARLAYAETSACIADPDFALDRTAELLDKRFAEKRAALIGERRCDAPSAGSLPASGTVQFCVVDEDGNAFSVVQSNYRGFGTGIVPDGCGFSLNNRALGFASDGAHANAAAGAKRPYHTIIPALMTDSDGALRAAFGVMGSYMQPQGHLQLVSALVDHGADAQDAVDAMRFRVTGAFSACEGSPDDEVLFPSNTDSDVLRELEERGHVTRVIHRAEPFGRAQIVLRDARTGIVEAGSDSRADGIAVALPRLKGVRVCDVVDV